MKFLKNERDERECEGGDVIFRTAAAIKFQYCGSVSCVHIGDSAVNYFSINGVDPSNFPSQFV